MNISSVNEQIQKDVIKEFDNGNFQLALSNFKKIIDIYPNIEKRYSLKGNILYRLGKVDEAIKILEEGIDKLKDIEGCYAALGYIEEKHFTNFDKAYIYYKKSIEKRPTAPVLNNLGVLYLNGNGTKQDFEKAIDYFDQALTINPKYYQACLNKGYAFFDKKQFKDALKFSLEPFITNDIYKFDDNHPAFGQFYKNILVILNTLSLNNQFHNSHSKILLPILKREIYNDQEIGSILKHSTVNHIQTFLLQGYRNDAIYNAKTYNSSINLDNLDTKNILYTENFLSFIDSPFFTIGLSNYVNLDLTIEYILTSIRKLILLEYYENPRDLSANERLHNFVISLCNQGHLNEYIWKISNEEKECLIKLKGRIEKESNKGNAITSMDICILGSYKNLYEYKKLRKNILENSFDSDVEKIIKTQILDIIEENKIKENISSVGSLENKISLKVRNQYENNPYPRWQNTGIFSIKRPYLEMFKRSIIPNWINTDGYNIKKVLVAGCGTGFHPINLAYADKNIHIDAIDISLSSLAYAQRKANELNIKNISFYQCDILNIEKIGEEYDSIECSGVLHHMENPQKGFDALSECLKKEGLLKIALYAKSFRQNLLEAKEFLQKNNASEEIETIRYARDQLILSGRNDTKKSLMKYPIQLRDFYTTSEFIDLLMHVQEHDFTTEELKKLFGNSFNFLGFTFANDRINPYKENYKERFPEDIKMTDLDNWAILEKENPSIFMSMYQFWLQKL